MAQRQVLGARRRADRVGLYKAQPVEGASERGGREETVAYGKAAEIVQGDGHNERLAGVRGDNVSFQAPARALAAGALHSGADRTDSGPKPACAPVSHQFSLRVWPYL
jgi:hypothetical protein